MSDAMRSRGTTMCTPLDARTRNRPRPPDSRWISSVHTPVQFSTTCARTSASRPSSQSRTRTPGDPVRLPQEADDLGRRADHRTVAGRGAGQRHGVPGVVGLRRRSSAPRRSARPAAARASAAAPRRGSAGGAAAASARRPASRRESVRRRRTAAPTAGGCSGYRKLTGLTRCGASRVSISSRSASASPNQPELQLFQIAQPAVEQLRRPARRARWPGRGPRPAPPDSPRVAASRAAPLPTTPPPITTTSNCPPSSRRQACSRYAGPSSAPGSPPSTPPRYPGPESARRMRASGRTLRRSPLPDRTPHSPGF